LRHGKFPGNERSAAISMSSGRPESTSCPAENTTAPSVSMSISRLTLSGAMVAGVVYVARKAELRFCMNWYSSPQSDQSAAVDSSPSRVRFSAYSTRVMEVRASARSRLTKLGMMPRS
jgi:hypothetical protein